MTLHPITAERYSKKRWIRYTNYKFAAEDAVAPLVVQELSKAVMHLPICFIPDGESFLLAAVQGLQPGKNLCVSPDGRWLVGYTPAAYRAYPFAVAKAQDETQLICFDEDSGLLDDENGELFYEEDGQLAQGINNVVSFLTEVTKNRLITVRICAALQEHNLIQPWPVKIQAENGEHTVNGLYQVDEAALNDLSIEAFDQLRKAGAIPVAYCQLLSMQHLQRLGELAKAHLKAAAPPPGLDFLKADHGSLDFSSLGD